MAVVHQPPYKCGGHLLIIQDIYPSGKLQICIKDNDFLFMDLGKIVKQQLGTGSVVRDIPEFLQEPCVYMKKGIAIFLGWLFPFVYCVAGVDAYTAAQAGRLFPVFVNVEAPWGKARASAGVLSSVGLELR